MRAFIGIQPGAAAVQAIGTCLAPFRRSVGASLRWIDPRNLHLTLCFLGEIADDRLQVLDPLLARVCSGAEEFHWEMSGPHYFPNLARARVLAFRVGGPPELHRLQDVLGERLRGQGFGVDRRRFRPHLSVARLRRGVRPPQPCPACQAVRCAADAVLLLTSRLEPTGARYNVLRRYPLGSATP